MRSFFRIYVPAPTKGGEKRMDVKLRPGDSSFASQFYLIVNPDFGETPYLRYVRIGDTMPPTPGKREWYIPFKPKNTAKLN